MLHTEKKNPDIRSQIRIKQYLINEVLRTLAISVLRRHWFVNSLKLQINIES